MGATSFPAMALYWISVLRPIRHAGATRAVHANGVHLVRVGNYGAVPTPSRPLSELVRITGE
jgi:hypothetical protein